MAEGSGGRRDVWWGIAAAISLLALFAGVDRLLQHERDRLAQAQARVAWQQIADVLVNSVGEVPRTLALRAATIDLDPTGSPKQVVARLAAPVVGHVEALAALGLEDAQGRPMFAYPTGHSLHAADSQEIRFS